MIRFRGVSPACKSGVFHHHLCIRMFYKFYAIGLLCGIRPPHPRQWWIQDFPNGVGGQPLSLAKICMKTRMNSSRMHVVRCSGRLMGGRVVCPEGGISTQRGGVCPVGRGGNVCPVGGVCAGVSARYPPPL